MKMKTYSAPLLGGVAAAVLVAGGAGFGLARLTALKPSPAEAPRDSSEAVADTLALRPEAISAAGIEVETVRAGGFAAEIPAQATVVALPSGQAVLTARAAGAVSRIYKRLGDPVRAGETLAVVESREAAQIAADRSVATARASLASTTLAREQRLYEQRVSPRQDYEQAQAEAAVAAAEARRAQLAAGAAQVSRDGRGVLVISPISGRIMSASAGLGAFVQPETELFRVADPTLVQIEAQVNGADAARVAPGDAAMIETADGRRFPTTVRSVTPGLNIETRAATVVVDAPVGAGLQPGQAVRAYIRPRASGSNVGVALPEEAVQTVGGREVVFVRTANGFQAKSVRIGGHSAGRVEVVEGLTAGMTVATRNAFVLKAELAKGEGEKD